MANWCANKLTIKGSEQEIKRFREEARNGDEPLSLHKFIPMPEELSYEGLAVDPQWLQYALITIGTKWDIDQAEVTRNNRNCLEYFFYTAWSEPARWILRVSAAFPALTFTLWYEEPGNGFRGEYIVRGGKVLSDKDLTKEMIREYAIREKEEDEI